MSLDRKTPEESLKDLRCVRCQRKFKTMKKVFPLGHLPIHYHCLVKEIEKNKYREYPFTIMFQIYIEDLQLKRETYLADDKLYSNRETYTRFAEKKGIVKLLNNGLLEKRILGGQFIIPYAFAKQQYLLLKEKHLLIYYLASKFKLLSPSNLLDFYSDNSIILPAFESSYKYPILFMFPKQPPDTIRWWLRGFCKEISKVAYETNNHVIYGRKIKNESGIVMEDIPGIFSFDKNIAIVTRNSDIPEDPLRENVLKYLKGQEVQQFDFTDGSIRAAFQGKGMKGPAAIVEKGGKNASGNRSLDINNGNSGADKQRTDDSNPEGNTHKFKKTYE